MCVGSYINNWENIETKLSWILNVTSHRVQKVEAARADAEKIRLIGEAEATSIEAVGKAEAERMRLKASAYKQYGDAAMVSLILETLPKVSHRVFYFIIPIYGHTCTFIYLFTFIYITLAFIVYWGIRNMIIGVFMCVFCGKCFRLFNLGTLKFSAQSPSLSFFINLLSIIPTINQL